MKLGQFSAIFLLVASSFAKNFSSKDDKSALILGIAGLILGIVVIFNMLDEKIS